MKTMVKEPYVHHVPVLTGGVGYDEVYNFYKTHFVGKMPDDHPFYFNSMSDETKREEIREETHEVEDTEQDELEEEDDDDYEEDETDQNT
jgi:hypothetical protein